MSELRSRVTRIELNQENVILPLLNDVVACYTSTFERYKASVDGYEEKPVR